MTVFAWILFVITALSAIGLLQMWFSDGEGIFSFLGAAASVVYLIFYLFLTPFNATVTWVYFIIFCILTLVSLFLRQLPTFLGFGIYALFYALVLFL
jgi:hypothetical protein